MGDLCGYTVSIQGFGRIVRKRGELFRSLPFLLHKGPDLHVFNGKPGIVRFKMDRSCCLSLCVMHDGVEGDFKGGLLARGDNLLIDFGRGTPTTGGDFANDQILVPLIPHSEGMGNHLLRDGSKVIGRRFHQNGRTGCSGGRLSFCWGCLF